MEFINNSPFPAIYTKGSFGDREQMGLVTTKVTFSIEKEGTKNVLIPVDVADMWPIFEEPFSYEEQTLNVEVDFRQTKLDLIVFGKARSKNAEPVPKLAVGIQSEGKTLIGRWVFGHRFWLKDSKSLYASEPRPFVEMPLTNAYCFGGKTNVVGTDVVHPINPDGRGFHLEIEQAFEKPLPNIERPDQLIAKWDDQPVPACLYKTVAPPEIMNLQEEDTNTLIKMMFRHNFQSAVSELQLNPSDLGKSLRFIGFSHEGDIYIPTPPIQAPMVRVAMGDVISRFPAILSTLVVLLDENLVIATYQSKFRYLMNPYEKRHAELRWIGKTSFN